MVAAATIPASGIHVAWVALGSNLGSPAHHVGTALAALAAATNYDLLAASSLYRTAPVGGPPDQPTFCNACAALATRLDPFALLTQLHALEARHARVRRQRFGPRTLDLDIVAFNDCRLESPGLTLPHPRAAERAFVLVPLAEIAPALSLDRAGRVVDCLARVDGADVVPWPAAGAC